MVSVAGLRLRCPPFRTVSTQFVVSLILQYYIRIRTLIFINSSSSSLFCRKSDKEIFLFWSILNYFRMTHTETHKLMTLTRRINRKKLSEQTQKKGKREMCSDKKSLLLSWYNFRLDSTSSALWGRTYLLLSSGRAALTRVHSRSATCHAYPFACKVLERPGAFGFE